MNSLVRCPDGNPPVLISLGSESGIRLTLMEWGATWLSCGVPVAGATREVLLGCGRLEDYFTQKAFLGATVGRYANRIAGAEFSQNDRVIRLTPNEGGNQLHGGPQGFWNRRWQIAERSGEQVAMRLISPDGDQGFPGTLIVLLRIRVHGAEAVSLDYEATVDAPCPVNLTNHAYFNLDGMASDIREHRLRIDAGRYLPVGEALIPTGELAPVAGSGFDFRREKPIGGDFLCDAQQAIARGYDHAFLLDPDCRHLKRPAARLVSGDGELSMDVFTTLPALQFYSGNYLDGVPARDGRSYHAYQGLALETQFLPDSPHHPEWPQPSCWLQPGETYRHRTVLFFQPRRTAPHS